MKKFSELSIGDTVYMIPGNVRLLDQQDQYGNVTKANLESVSKTVSNLYATQEGNLLINRGNEDYQGRSSSFAVIPIEYLNKNIYKSKSGDIIFSNINHFERIKMSLVMGRINKAENDIKAAIAHQNDIIRRVRVQYFELLNPKMCKNA